MTKERKVDKRRNTLDSAYIIAEYNSGKSTATIAKDVNSSESSITRRLIWAGVALRNVNEACAYLRNKRLPVSDENLQSIFDGLLLGDAWVESDGKSEGRLAITQCEAHLDWLLQLKNIFDKYQIKSTLSKTKNRGWLLRTGKYTDFTLMRQRWYPEGCKIIPSDLRITPTTLAHWHWGDGTISNYGYTISLCTDSFSKDDVLFLIDLLKKDLGIHSAFTNKQKKYPRINIYRKQDRISMVNLVKEYCPECFLYKLRIKQ